MRPRLFWRVLLLTAIVPLAATATAAAPPKMKPSTTSQAKPPSSKSKPKPKPKPKPTSSQPPPKPKPSPAIPPAPSSIDPDPEEDTRPVTQAPPPPPPSSSGGICDIDPSACPKQLAALPRIPPQIGVDRPLNLPPPTPPPPTPVAPQAAEAQWQLALALANAKLAQGAMRVLSGIAHNPLHPHHRDALARLGLFARGVPDGSDLDRWFGAATLPLVSSIPHDPQNSRSAALFLLGKHRYSMALYQEAATAFAAVDDADPLKPRALLYQGAAHVQLRAAVPAIHAFQRARAILDAAPPSTERAMLNELALLSMARTYYSSATRLDDNNAPTIDSSKLSAAVVYYEKINPGASLWPDAAHELAWAFLIAGDYAHAGGHARFLSSDASNGAHAFPAHTIRAMISFTHCLYDESEKQVIALNKVAEQTLLPLSATIKRTTAEGGEDAFANLMLRFDQLQEAPATKQVIGRARLDWRISRRLAYLARVEAEAVLLNSMTPSLASAPALVAEARAAIDAERARTIRSLSMATRAFLEHEHDEMVEAMMNSQRILIDVTAAKRNQLDAAVAGQLVSIAEARATLAVKAQDPQHDPFERVLPDHVRRYQTGLFYTLSVTKCGR